MIEYVESDGMLFAIIVRSNYQADGISFFTPGDFSQQLGYMQRPAGYKIPPHVHNPVAREVTQTQEVLFVKRGKVRVDFYDTARKYAKSLILHGGDVIILATGGHGFCFLEEGEIIEVKQGPYAGDTDKTRFQGIADSDVLLAPDMQPHKE